MRKLILLAAMLAMMLVAAPFAHAQWPESQQCMEEVARMGGHVPGEFMVSYYSEEAMWAAPQENVVPTTIVPDGVPDPMYLQLLHFEDLASIPNVEERLAAEEARRQEIPTWREGCRLQRPRMPAVVLLAKVTTIAVVLVLLTLLLAPMVLAQTENGTVDPNPEAHFRPDATQYTLPTVPAHTETPPSSFGAILAILITARRFAGPTMLPTCLSSPFTTGADLRLGSRSVQMTLSNLLRHALSATRVRAPVTQACCSTNRQQPREVTKDAEEIDNYCCGAGVDDALSSAVGSGATARGLHPARPGLPCRFRGGAVWRSC